MFGKFQALVGRAAWLPAAVAADAELGRRGDRQADRAADRERRRLDQPVRAQRGRGHPPQFRLDAGAAGVSDRDRGWLLSGQSGDNECALDRGLCVMAGVLRVMADPRVKRPRTGSGRLPTSFLCATQQNRGWPAGACPWALDPRAGHDTGNRFRQRGMRRNASQLRSNAAVAAGA